MKLPRNASRKTFYTVKVPGGSSIAIVVLYIIAYLSPTITHQLYLYFGITIQPYFLSILYSCRKSNTFSTTPHSASLAIIWGPLPHFQKLDKGVAPWPLHKFEPFAIHLATPRSGLGRVRNLSSDPNRACAWRLLSSLALPRLGSQMKGEWIRHVP